MLNTKIFYHNNFLCYILKNSHIKCIQQGGKSPKKPASWNFVRKYIFLSTKSNEYIGEFFKNTVL